MYESICRATPRTQPLIYTVSGKRDQYVFFCNSFYKRLSYFRGKFVAPGFWSWVNRTKRNLGRSEAYYRRPQDCLECPMFCYILKPEHFKADCGRKSRTNFGFFDPNKN